MRGIGYNGHPSYVYAPTVINTNSNNVTNVTNIAYVTNVSGLSRGFRKSFPGRQSKGGNQRVAASQTPELLRYCSSGGLLDQGKVSGMSREEMCCGAVGVIHHGAKGIASNICGVVGCFTRGVAGMIGALFS